MIRRTTIDEAETKEMHFEESARATAIQIFIPFLAAGLGMVAAGVLLHHVLVSSLSRSEESFVEAVLLMMKTDWALTEWNRVSRNAGER